jgi:hypothetical protein
LNVLNVTNVDILQWFPDDPSSGLLFFILGFFGALVTVYFYVGEFLPMMGGLTRIKELRLDVTELKSRISELRSKWDTELKVLDKLVDQYDMKGIDTSILEKKIDAQKTKIHEIESRVGKLEDDSLKKEKIVNSERRSIMTTGLIIYLILGGFFATLLSKDVLQAVIIGAGWTTFASTLGLKRQEEQASKRREEEAEQSLRGQDKLEEFLVESEKVISDLNLKIQNSSKMVREAYLKGVGEGVDRTIKIYEKKT